MYKQATLVLVICFLQQAILQAQTQKTLFTGEDAESLITLFQENKKIDSGSLKHFRNVQTFYAIFKEYGGYKTINDSVLLKENPFITPEMLIRLPPVKQNVSDTMDFTKENVFGPGLGLEEVVVAGAFSPTGGSNWQTAVLDGTAKFLAQRFKEELAAYYLNTFYNKLDNKPVVKTLFPKTVEFLRVFANQIFNTDIAMLQAAAEEDLNNLPVNLINALDYIEAFKKDPLLKAGLSLGLDLYKEQKTGIDIAELINGLPSKNYLPASYKSYFSVLRILSNSLRDSEPDEGDAPWSGIGEIDFFDPAFSKDSYYYALLYEQLKNIPLEGKTLQQRLGNKMDSWQNWFQTLTGFFRELNAFNNFIYEQKKMSRTRPVDFWETLLRSAATVNSVFPVIEQCPDNSLKIPVAVRKIADNTASLLQLIRRVQDKKYEQVVPNLIMLLTSLDSNISNSELVPYMRYAAVIAQFASVKTADDMKNLLQSLALPIGSASIKRKSKWNVALNAYVGAAVGNEKVKTKLAEQDKTSIGLSAPLGIAISRQYRGVATSSAAKGPLIPSGSLYLSVLDIGNLVNVRLKSDTASIGNIRFSHFISLGVGYHVNFRNSPFTAGLSWSYTPSYRDVFVNNQWSYKGDAMRIRFSLLVDIPLFNLYTSTND